MAEETTTMTNIDIKNFDTVQSLNDSDYIVLSLYSGVSAKVTLGLIKTLLTATISPTIQDGVWYVGGTSMGVEAEGKTPEMRRGSLGIEYKYTTENDTAWRLLVAYTDIKLQYDALTTDQKNEIITGVKTQIHDEVVVDVDIAVSNANAATNSANNAAKKAISAADAANKYANRVVDLTEAEWEALEESGTWVEGVEYNVYEV